MRTTVTLDDDDVAALRRVERECGVSFEEALNSAIRAGLAGRDATAVPFTVHTFAAEVEPGVELTRANRLLADLEDEELARKLDLRK